MSENIYLNSFISGSRESKREYRDSGIHNEEEEESIQNDSIEPEQPVDSGKINSFNVSGSTEPIKTKQKSDSQKFLTSNELICIANILASTLGGGAFVFSIYYI